ncbi:MAG: SsrA-binding protein [Chloroflexi bacterium HGW-Chloroflexi-10]|nr:MAG: SsrA-binding protein [Chloroflexi bacterium HGW-Chloroflexi-10]
MENIKVISKNRKATFEYFLLESFEAGLSLQGSEIKSIRAGQVSITEAFIQIENMEAWLMNAHIAPYESASYFNHDPKRKRRLLLHKKEVSKMWNEVRQKGVTIVPVKLYIKNGLAKIEIAIAKGKKLYDKRDSIAKRDQDRETSRNAKKYE